MLDELLAEVPGKELPLAPTQEVDEISRSGDAQATPRSRQIADLCGEVDSCLAALDRMEEENKHRAQALRREMQADSVQFPTLTSPISDGCEASGELSLSHQRRRAQDREDAIYDAYYQAASVSPSRSRVQLPVPVHRPGSPSLVTSPTSMQAEEESLRRADEARIAKLRNEVEGLRVKEADMQREIMQQWLDVEALDGSVPAASEVEAAPSAALSALVAEANSVLGDLDSSLPGRRPTDDERAIDSLEQRLAEAQQDLGHMEGVLGSAEGALDCEIKELERMLAAETADPAALRDQGDSSEPDQEAQPY